jgi:hypothetical protein
MTCFIPGPGHFKNNLNKSNIKKHCSYIWEGVSDQELLGLIHLQMAAKILSYISIMRIFLKISHYNQLCWELRPELRSKSCQSIRGLTDIVKCPNWWSNVVIDNHMEQETILATIGEVIGGSINANPKLTNNTYRKRKGTKCLANTRVT